MSYHHALKEVFRMKECLIVVANGLLHKPFSPYYLLNMLPIWDETQKAH